MTLTYNGAAFVFLGAGLLAAGLGIASRTGTWTTGAASRSAPTSPRRSPPSRSGRRGERPAEGFFIALEGGEGAGKSTQAQALRGWLESLGHDVVVTFEPGATEVGRRLRSVLLDHPEPIEGGDGAAPPHLSPRAEALLFAADRAEHVATVVRPALELATSSSPTATSTRRSPTRAPAATCRLPRWPGSPAGPPTGLQPHLTVLLDVPAPRRGWPGSKAPDRLESEPRDFHDRVRERFLELARRGGARYLVVDGTRPADEITDEIKARLEPVLPLSAQQIAELERCAPEQDRARPAGGQRRAGWRRRGPAPRPRSAPRPEAAAAEAARLLAEQEAAVLAEERRVQRGGRGCRAGAAGPRCTTPTPSGPARSTPGCAPSTPRNAGCTRSRPAPSARRRTATVRAGTARPVTTRRPVRSASSTSCSAGRRRRLAVRPAGRPHRAAAARRPAARRPVTLPWPPAPASGPTWSARSRRSRCCGPPRLLRRASCAARRRAGHDPRLAVHRPARLRPVDGGPGVRRGAAVPATAAAAATATPATPHWPAPTPTSRWSTPASCPSASTTPAPWSPARRWHPAGGRWQVMVVEDADRLDRRRPATRCSRRSRSRPRAPSGCCARRGRGRAAHDPLPLPAPRRCVRRRPAAVAEVLRAAGRRRPGDGVVRGPGRAGPHRPGPPAGHRRGRAAAAARGPAAAALAAGAQRRAARRG